MKKQKHTKLIPFFSSELEEARFWDKVDSTRYFSGEGKVHLKLPARTTAISIRLPNRLLGRLKKLATIKDVPYQSLLKVYLDEKVDQEIIHLRKVS